eukprot:7532427-Pyramimonas_sp.AAC.1
MAAPGCPPAKQFTRLARMRKLPQRIRTQCFYPWPGARILGASRKKRRAGSGRERRGARRGREAEEGDEESERRERVPAGRA